MSKNAKAPKIPKGGIDPKVEEQRKAAEKRQKELDERFDALEERMKDLKYFDQTYKEGSEVNVDGILFSDMLNTLTAFRQSARKVQEFMAIGSQILEQYLEKESTLIASLMELHLDNVDKGITVKLEEDVKK